MQIKPISESAANAKIQQAEKMGAMQGQSMMKK
jgi:hypothetical protein